MALQVIDPISILEAAIASPKTWREEGGKKISNAHKQDAVMSV
uniref:Uncharacterized protein n=1 Tax=Arundo donax TaxID=35708 RepID=A0A0A9HUV1_ARUDO